MLPLQCPCPKCGGGAKLNAIGDWSKVLALTCRYIDSRVCDVRPYLGPRKPALGSRRNTGIRKFLMENRRNNIRAT